MEEVKPIRPDFKSAALINQQAKADVTLCWTCGTCDAECPVNEATNRLSPRKIVRMATIGLFDEMVRMPEIWYCMACNRCARTCPTLVTPLRIISLIREEALKQGFVSAGVVAQYRKFFSAFQRVRWHVVERCFDGELTELTATQWNDWLNTPIASEKSVILGDLILKRRNDLSQMLSASDSLACFTCSECTNACPLKSERAAFDPLWITRMANLGLTEELLRSPAIWLCVQCGQCTATCSQSVKVHSLIKGLRELAMDQGIVDSGFHRRLKRANRVVYPRYVDEVDRIIDAEGGAYETPYAPTGTNGLAP